jgi:hypothetical protein
MTQNIKNLFKNLQDLEPSQLLEEKILKAIAFKKSLEIRKKLMFARAGLVASFGAFFYMFFIFGKSFLESDFFNLIKLVFSDTGIIITHLGEFSISLLETLPVIEIFAMLVPVFILAMMFSYYFKFTNNNHYNHIR